MAEVSTERNPLAADTPAGGFRHEALLYAGLQEFVHATVPFIRAAIDRGEPLLAMVDPVRIAALRDALGPDREIVEFADMREVGSNPARILPSWSQFWRTRAPSGRRVWGIGEPVWAGRDGPGLVEAQHHERLLNVAFPDADMWLLCAYDTSALDPERVDEARRSHPYIRLPDGSATPVATFDPETVTACVLADELPEPSVPTKRVPFGAGQIRELRGIVAAWAAECGLTEPRTDDLVVAVNEVATNSIRHGNGAGEILLWVDAGSLMCDVRDRGRISDPLLGRLAPPVGGRGGRGLWLAHHLCDLVQVRSSEIGTTVRLFMHVGPGPR